MRRKRFTATITTSTTVRRTRYRPDLSLNVSECIVYYCSRMFVKAWHAAAASALFHNPTYICVIALGLLFRKPQCCKTIAATKRSS
eukprot:COSAG02_NODE_2_length_75708_cov_87.013953_46_plen_86_part_00